MDDTLLQWLIIIFAALGGGLYNEGNKIYKENQKLIKNQKLSDDRKQYLSKVPIIAKIGIALLMIALYLFIMYILELRQG